MIRPLLASAVLLASPALAQSTTDSRVPSVPAAPAGGSILDRDNVTVGLGAAVLPSYEGSDSSVVTVAPLLRGSVKGFNFSAQGPGVSVDLLRESRGAKLDLQAGPVLSLNLDRTSRINDPVVERLGDIGVAVQGGGFVGVAVNGLLNPFDTAGVRVDVVTDLGSVHDGTLVTPSINYATPLSTALYATVSVAATRASGNYMDRYFSVTPAGALASGLPAFRADGGWKNVGGSLAVLYDLSGDLRDGGIGLFATGGYSRLQESARRSPIVTLRGDPDQLFAAAGVSYTF